MTELEFNGMCENHGLYKLQRCRYAGMERGWPVALTWGGKNKVTVSLPTHGDDEKTYKSDLKTALRDRMGKAASALWNQGALIIYIKIKNMSDPYAEAVLPVLDAVKSTGFTVADRCEKCGLSGCDRAIPRGAAYTPVHKNCLDVDISNVKTRADDNSENGSYLLGFIGAVLGMLVGIIPSALTIIFMNRIYVLLFMLIPLAVYLGYKLLRGKMNYTALILSIFLSVPGVYLLNYASLAASLGEEFELKLLETLSLLPAAIRDPEIFMLITKSEDFIKCAVFAALGIFLAWGQISRTNKIDIKDAQGVLDSSIPYGSSIQDQPSDGVE